jgi:hypothetical protein
MLSRILSYAVSSKTRKFSQSGISTIEYPEVNKLLAEGYQINDVLPPWGSGDVYYITIILLKEEPSDTEEEETVNKPQRRKR